VETPRFSRHTEDFDCGRCGQPVRGNGYTNHCPRCLWSRHVDVQPGDRAATCGELMEPVGAEHAGGRTVLVQRCLRCGRVWRNKVAPDDDADAVLALFAEVVQPGPAARPARRRRPDRSGRR
jgi:DNA-directed RNA polymerase subunit RPC12/RpoP